MPSGNKDTMTNIDEYFEKLEATRKDSFLFYDFMEEHINNCMSNTDYDSLFELLPYWEIPDKSPNLTYSADAIRVYHILQILEWEKKYHKEPFVKSLNNFAELKERYCKTVFSIRRLEMNLPDNLITEAINYLFSIPFDIYAAELLISIEFFENYDQIYSRLLQHFSDVWSLEDRILFNSMWEKKSDSEPVYLTLSSLYMEGNDLFSAYSALNQIKYPSAETVEFIKELKEVLQNESK